MRSFKMCITQKRGEGRLTKKITKKIHRGRVRSEKMLCQSLKKTRDFAGDLFSYTDLFGCIFYFYLSVFVDGVISFL